MQRCRTAAQREIRAVPSIMAIISRNQIVAKQPSPARSTINHHSLAQDPPPFPARFGFGSPGLGRGYAVSDSRLDRHVYFQPQWSPGSWPAPRARSGWVALDAGWWQKAQGKPGNGKRRPVADCDKGRFHENLPLLRFSGPTPPTLHTQGSQWGGIPSAARLHDVLREIGDSGGVHRSSNVTLTRAS